MAQEATLARNHRRSSPWLPLAFAGLALAVGSAAGALVMGVSSTLQVAIVAIGLTALVATVAQIEWGLLVLVFIVYVRLSDIAIAYHGAPSIAKSFIVLLVVAILARWAVYRERPKGWERGALLIAAYGLVGTASLLYAADPERAQEAASDFLKDGAIAVIITILLQRGATLRRVIWAFLAAGLFLGTLSVFQYFTGTFANNYGGFAQSAVQNIIGDVNDRRVAGPIGDPNFYAQILLVIVPLALDRFWNERRRTLKLIALWALGVTALGIVFTFSRGGFLALVVMLSAMFIYRRVQPRDWLTILAAVIIVWQFVPHTYAQRIGTLLDFIPGLGVSSREVREEVSFRGRASEFLVGLLMFADRPILGVGWDNYPVYYQYYSRQVGLDPRVEERSPHNLYIEIASETGLLGLVTMGLILFEVFRAIWRAYRVMTEAGLRTYAPMVAAFGMAVLGYLTAAFFIHGAYPRYLWLLVGVAYSLPHVAHNEISAHVVSTGEYRQISASEAAQSA